MAEIYKNMHKLKLIFKERNIRDMFLKKTVCSLAKEEPDQKENGKWLPEFTQDHTKIACATQQRLHFSPELLLNQNVDVVFEPPKLFSALSPGKGWYIWDTVYSEKP